MLLCGLGRTPLGAAFWAVSAQAQEDEEEAPEEPYQYQENNVDPEEQRQQQRQQTCIMTGTCSCAFGVCTDNSTGAKFRAPAQPKPDVWGALAVSPSTLAWGNSWNYKTGKEAEAEALKNCRTYSKGARDCRVAVTVADVCVSMAASMAQKIYTVGGPTGAANFAADNAMLKCKRAGGRACVIATSFCADGVKHELKGHTVFSNGNPIFVPEGQGQPFGRRR